MIYQFLWGTCWIYGFNTDTSLESKCREKSKNQKSSPEFFLPSFDWDESMGTRNDTMRRKKKVLKFRNQLVPDLSVTCHITFGSFSDNLSDLLYSGRSIESLGLCDSLSFPRRNFSFWTWQTDWTETEGKPGKAITTVFTAPSEAHNNQRQLMSFVTFPPPPSPRYLLALLQSDRPTDLQLELLLVCPS